MRQYQAGSTVDLRHEVRDATNTLVDSAVEMLLTLPDGTTDAPAPTHAGTGLYDFAFTVDEYGPYTIKITTSGAVGNVRFEQIYVADDLDALPPLASLARLAKKMGFTSPADMPPGEAGRGAGYLSDASALIRDVAGKTWTDPVTGALDVIPPRVRQICVEAAFRAFGNPEALSQRSIGDLSRSYDRKSREGGEAVYLTGAEESAIQRAAGASSLNVVTLVSPYSAHWLDDDGEVVWA